MIISAFMHRGYFSSAGRLQRSSLSIVTKIHARMRVGYPLTRPQISSSTSRIVFNVLLRLVSFARSPSQGPCCTQDCVLKLGEKCRDDNGCRSASYCEYPCLLEAPYQLPKSPLLTREYLHAQSLGRAVSLTTTSLATGPSVLPRRANQTKPSATKSSSATWG